MSEQTSEKIPDFIEVSHDGKTTHYPTACITRTEKVYYDMYSLDHRDYIFGIGGHSFLVKNRKTFEIAEQAAKIPMTYERASQCSRFLTDLASIRVSTLQMIGRNIEEKPNK